MKVYDSVELAWRNLRESRLRNSLTTIGIAVGVASLVAMLALGVGLQQLAGRRLERSGLFNTVVAFPQEEFRPGERPVQQAPENKPLDQSARLQMAKMPGVVEVYPEIRFAGELRVNEKSQFAFVGALPMSAAQDEAFEKMQGKFFSSANAGEAILQKDFAARLLAPNRKPAAPPPDLQPLLGKEVILRYAARVPSQPAAGHDSGNQSADWGFSVAPSEQHLRVVGIIDEEPYGGMRGFGRGNIFVPQGLAESLNVMQPAELRNTVGKEQTYSSLVVRVRSYDDVQPVEDAVKKMGFGAFSLLDAARNLQRFFAVLDLFLGIFGSLALAVASLGIINTLVMAILERRREIGIMKAIGASDADVRGLFFLEAGVMGAMGGTFGVLLGWIIGRSINFGANIYLERRQFPPEQIWAVPWWLVAGAIVFAVVVSLLAGLYPAARASRLDPVEALRYE